MSTTVDAGTEERKTSFLMNERRITAVVETSIDNWRQNPLTLTANEGVAAQPLATSAATVAVARHVIASWEHSLSSVHSFCITNLICFCLGICDGDSVLSLKLPLVPIIQAHSAIRNMWSISSGGMYIVRRQKDTAALISTIVDKVSNRQF